MVWLAVLVCVLCAPICPPMSVAAQDATEGENTAAEIRGLERAWSEGEARNDNRALDLIFDNALVYIEYGKVMTKGEYLSRIRTEKPHTQLIVMEGITVRTFGTAAIVVGIYRERDVKDGKVSVSRWRFIDTWVKKQTGWLLVAAASSPLPK
jgi:hypothetical protein